VNEAIVGVLVVDDFENWRKFVCTAIDGIAGLEVIGEASDGREAVKKAGELRPDLVLLDIGLPSLNGIDVALAIRKVSPESKIIFVTEDQSSDVIKECFHAGARAYVVKSSANRDLISAIQSAIKSKPS